MNERILKSKNVVDVEIIEKLSKLDYTFKSQYGGSTFSETEIIRIPGENWGNIRTGECIVFVKIEKCEYQRGDYYSVGYRVKSWDHTKHFSDHEVGLHVQGGTGVWNCSASYGVFPKLRERHEAVIRAFIGE